MRLFPKLIGVVLAVSLVACSTTKNIPEGKYLLNEISVKHDTKNATSDLELFVQQQPNTTIPLLGKVRLMIYNMAGQDSTKWGNRVLKNIGQKPVIYNISKARLSMSELQKEAVNQGYINAVVDTTQKVKGKKLAITYHLKGGDPYMIRHYTNDVQDSMIHRIVDIVPLEAAIKSGDFYDMSMLEKERDRISLIMRNAGYYNFSKELVYFKADTTLNSHQVDLYLNVYPSPDGHPYHRSRMNKVTIVSGINSEEATNMVQGLSTNAGGRNRRRNYMNRADTTMYHDVMIIRGQEDFLRNSSIHRNIFMKKGSYFGDMALNRTYEAFNKMGAIKQVNITTNPSPDDSLHLIDATILLTPANAHWFRANIDGTNSAGDFGIAPGLSYSHQNLFNGSERLDIKLKGAYEIIAGKNSVDINADNFYEYGIETGLTFPLFMVPWLKKEWREMPSAQTRFSAGLNNQHRKEYTREFFNLTANYSWTSNKNRLRHGVDLLDINYIRMPSVSAQFDSIYLSNPKNPLLRESYKDQLIARTSYSFSFINRHRFNMMAPTYNLRGTVEVSGHLPRLVSSMSGKKQDGDGQNKILGVAYSEYVKATLDYSRTMYFSKQHSLAYHVGGGIAQAYGNSKILPFERRFFGGGANSVRGWSTRRLGPGSYKGEGTGKDFVNQAGDFKLEFSIENRHKITDLIELAEFVDAGNIWTLRSYESQPGGQFQLKSFYKEIALAYGAGIRADLGFLLLRFDAGMRAYDPERTGARWVILKPRMNRIALHFGIGYPF